MQKAIWENLCCNRYVELSNKYNLSFWEPCACSINLSNAFLTWDLLSLLISAQRTVGSGFDEKNDNFVSCRCNSTWTRTWGRWGEKEEKEGKKGGFQLLDLIITELKSQMTCYKIKVSHWWKFYLSKKNSLQDLLSSLNTVI